MMIRRDTTDGGITVKPGLADGWWSTVTVRLIAPVVSKQF